MRLTNLSISVLICICSSCSSDQQETDSDLTVSVDSSQSIPVPRFDTLEVISEMNITENFSRSDLINEKISGLQKKIDTLELTYYFGYCDCQDWILSEHYNEAEEENSDMDHLDGLNPIPFNWDDHSFYLEPATEELETDWRTHVNGTRIRVIGREYKEKGLAGKFVVPDPPLGRVFRYYSYEIIRPYKVWGPESIEDSISGPVVLTVR